MRNRVLTAFPYLLGMLLSLPFSTGGFGLVRVQTAVPASSKGRGGAFRADFDAILRLVRDRFYDRTMHGLDWNRVGETYRERLVDIRSKAEFETLVNDMLRELHASHTAYVTDDDIEYYMLPSVLRGDLDGHRVEHIGVTGHREDREFVITGVLDGGPADKAGLQSGDRLLLADGEPFRSAGSFRGKDGHAVTIHYRRQGNANLRTTTVAPVMQNILRAFLDATEKSAKVITIGGKRLAYIHLWTMADDAFRTTLDRLVLNKLHETDGLMLDLRDGYGGSPWNYADVFFRPDVAWEQQSRGYAAITKYTGYGKPMIVIINQGTRSAKEFLSYEFQRTHRATLVGTRTAGAFLGANGFQVGKDGLLELAVLGLKVDGKMLENNGIAPDIMVAAGLAYSERDVQILASQHALLEIIGSTSGAVAKGHESPFGSSRSRLSGFLQSGKVRE